MRDRYTIKRRTILRGAEEETCDKRGTPSVLYRDKGHKLLDIQGWIGGKECRVNIFYNDHMQVIDCMYSMTVA